ncbi:2-haloalkanoic acid dehalogenase [Photobacterium jeanii]|uniref:2-haloalkanoic acid dehalogenase n=1 Tax=Photobacterium jeanii TaxID=858640 RepID=A0A178KQX7_9GAMM|nr:5-amino-6-(5-phospho-D-ribitylamino)uracil phosphatase YigB [Photobacterium jeanii]OAN19174.1 2-haloalkanoic acid dehalogenase [Photobacterium jeanii]PST87182.1 5-amino-6-(5-phospho-D-ribitylamino)uracil phosphatase YigB [Photobacterium jeanii]
MQFYRQLKPIKAMSFDLDDTLYDNRPVIRRAEQAMHGWLYQAHPVSHMLTVDDWAQLKQQLAEVDPWLRHDVTLWRFEMIKIGLMQLGYSLRQASQAAHEGVATVLAVRNQVDVPAQTHTVLSALAQRVPLIAITNGNVDVEQIGLRPYFAHVLQAGRDGAAKPAPDMFVKAAQLVALPAENILHVGDHLNTDVNGAVRNGFQACWFNDQARSVQEAKHSRQLPEVEITNLTALLELV